MGSRSLQTAGRRSTSPVERGAERAKQIAANVLEADVGDIVVGDGQLEVSGVPSRGVTWADLAAASADASKLPAGMEPGGAAPRARLRRQRLDVSVRLAHRRSSRSTPRPAAVRLLRHVAVDDCGRILNPLLVAGQQHGGIAQGAAQALFEEVAYDERRQPGDVEPRRLRDPVGRRAAELRGLQHPDRQPAQPLGAKGIGESGTIGSTPAIQNAVVDAVSHLGVTHVDMPCTAERVWAAIQSAR